MCDSLNDGDKSTNWSHNGVSGTYVGAMTATVVQCFDSTVDDALDGSPTPDTKRDCDSTVWTLQTGQVASFEPLDFAATGIAGCDFESNIGNTLDDVGVPGVFPPDPAAEEHIDNGPDLYLIPDGTWDDGGTGGACHVSGYSSSCQDSTKFLPGGPLFGCPPLFETQPPPNANTGWANNAPTECTGTVWAEDWVLGDDVPIIVGCDSSNFTRVGLLSHAVNVLNCLSCVHDEVGATVEDLTVGGDPDEVQACTPAQGGGAWELVWTFGDSIVDTVILGKGDGHNGNLGTGVTVPGYVTPCTKGDVVVFVSNLVSANPFGHDVGTDCGAANGARDHDDGDGTNDRDWCSEDDFGWWLIGSSDDPDTPPCDGNTAFPYPATLGVEESPGPGLSPPESGECYDNRKDGKVVRGNHGRGDLIVYNPVAGWIDHFYDEGHSGDPGQDDLDGHHADCDPGPNGNKKVSNC